jgi:hypothetical protein
MTALIASVTYEMVNRARVDAIAAFCYPLIM